MSGRRSRERVEIETPEDLLEAARQRAWPDGLLERALEVGIPPGMIRGWLEWRPGTADDIKKLTDWHQRLTVGDLRGREASGADNDAFCDLWANSPEQVGDFEITTERGPNGFAQFRLQENVNLHVITDGNVIVASCGWSRRNVLVAGQRVSVRYGQALRVHRDYRRQGFGDMVRVIWGGMNVFAPSITQYDYMRAGNFAVVGWWKKYSPDFFDNTPQEEDQVPGIRVAIAQLPARSQSSSPNVRAMLPDDLPRCVELINRTHEGQDLFRPYTAEFLESRLDQGFWGEHPEWCPHVYGWEDAFVLEAGGRVVACAGLWDRGRDLRDRFRHRETGEERVVSDAALMDWGHEAGAEDAMVELLDHLCSLAHDLGRDYVLAPLHSQPGIERRLESREHTHETRYLRWGIKEPQITRPYTDLAYW